MPFSSTNPGESSFRPRKIDDAPFCWQHKAALRRIREAFDATTYLDQALAVYVALSELASDAQSESFEATRRKIAERSGVSIRRVSDILARLRSSNLLNWEQNYLEGTKELAASTYTLTPCTSSSTSCGPCTTLGTGVVSANCTVVEQSPEQLTEKSGKKPSREPWQIEKDRERIEREIQDLKRTGRKTFKDKFGVEHTERELTDEAKSRLDNLQMKIQALSQ